MITVWYVQSDEPSLKSYKWNVGNNELLPGEALDLDDIKIIRVEASDKELLHIEDMFLNLPMVSMGFGGNCVWRGELATFIVENLEDS